MTRTIAITGAGGDIGLAVAKALLAQGDAVAMIDLSQKALDYAVELLDHGDVVSQHVADVSDEAAVAATAQAIAQQHGRIDGVFANAGIPGGSHPISEQPMDEFRRIFEINIFGKAYTFKHFLPVIAEQPQGWAVATASVAALNASMYRSAYGGSKAAVLQLVRACALEYGSRNLRVNAICPGAQKGRLMEKINQSLPDPDAMDRAVIEGCAIGRYGDPNEVGELTRFLLTDAPAYLTGEAITIDGAQF